MSRPRIGAVSYLNTKPLVEGLDSLTDEIDLVFDLPSRLSDRLRRGDLDVALIPIIEVCNQPYTILSDACIACDGEVWSVKLMCRESGFDIDTLALDEGSRTSCALVKILLAQKHDSHPHFTPLPINQDWRTCDADAVLIIGDRAMKATCDQFPYEYDLGTAWKQWTGLPFVFAVWAARESAKCGSEQLERISTLLSEARDRGVGNVHQISADHAERFGLSNDECLAYLGRHVRFTLGKREKMAMEMYFRYANRMGLIPRVKELEYFTSTVS